LTLFPKLLLQEGAKQNNKPVLFPNSSCCPSLFEENIKDVPKRRNIRKTRRNIKKKIAMSHPSLVIKRGIEGELDNI